MELFGFWPFPSGQSEEEIAEQGSDVLRGMELSAELWAEAAMQHAASKGMGFMYERSNGLGVGSDFDDGQDWCIKHAVDGPLPDATTAALEYFMENFDKDGLAVGTACKCRRSLTCPMLRVALFPYGGMKARVAYLNGHTCDATPYAWEGPRNLSHCVHGDAPSASTVRLLECVHCSAAARCAGRSARSW